MVRMARTKTNIAAPNQGLAKIKTQTFNQSVPQFESEGKGLDPFRGDMTNAFNNFFGSLNESVGKVENFYEERALDEAKVYAQDMKARAATEAQDYYMQNPEARNVETALETEDTDLQSNRHFVNTYKQTLGSNIGSRMYSDFTSSQAGKSPANFEANAQAFWEENYTDGTGDPMVDLAMQTAWSRNYENNRISASQETIRRQRAAARLEHNRSIYRGMQGDVSIESLNTLMGSGSTTNGETRGKLAARNFGVIMEAVSNGDLSHDDLNVVNAWINNVPNSRPDGTGQSGQSVAQRFPILAAKAELQLPAIRARNATIEGQQAVVGITNSFNEGLSQFTDPVDQMTYLNENGPAAVEQLRNTRGVSGSSISAFRTSIDTKRNDMLDYVTSRNVYASVASGGSVPLGYDLADKANHPALIDAYRTAETPIAAGNLLGNVFRLNGPNAIPAALKDQLNSEMVNGSPEQRAKATNTILQASGVGQSFDINTQNALLNEDAQVRMNVVRSYIEQGEPTGDAIAMALQVDAAVELVSDEGWELQYNATGTKADQEAHMQDFFIGSNMLSYLEATVEGKGVIGRVFSFQNGKSITAQAQAAMRRAGDSFVIQQRTLGLGRPTEGQIRQHVSDTMVDKMYIEEGVWKFDESVESSTDRSRVRVGTSVINPETNVVENTIDNLAQDMAILEDSFFNNNFDGTFRTVADPDAVEINGQMVVMDGLPLNLSIGTDIQIDQEYYGEGENKGKLRGAFNDAVNAKTAVTLTGDLATDAELLFEALGPGVQLRPSRDLNGNIIGYGLTVVPRFFGTGSTDVEGLANEVRDMPVDANSFDAASGYPVKVEPAIMERIPANFWQTDEGRALKAGLDRNDPTAAQSLEGVARRFDPQN